jgi:hypothetical protein
MGLPLSCIGLRYQVGLIGFFGLIVLGLLYSIGLDQRTRAQRVADAATAETRRFEATFRGNPSTLDLAQHRDLVAPLGNRLATFHAEISTNGEPSSVRAVYRRTAAAADVSLTITGVTAAEDQTGPAAEQVLESSSELARQAEQRRMEVERFLATHAGAVTPSAGKRV